MYTDGAEDVPPKRLTAEELQRSVDRLSRIYRPEVELKPLVPRRVITKETLDKRIHHLYDESLARRQREREETLRQMDAAIKKDATITATTISSSDEEALVRHLYDESLALKKKNFEELYQHVVSRNTRNTRKLKPSEQTATADRLYREGMERERSKHIALYEKYVLSRRALPAHLTAEELAASADRMTKGEGVIS